MQMLRLSLALSAVLSCSAFANSDYQFEVGASYTEIDDIELYQVGGGYYFAPVDTSKGPLAEASFLDRQSSVAVLYQRLEFGGESDSDGLVAGEYVFSNQRAYINAIVSDDSYNRVGGGYYLSDTWLVDAGVRIDDDMDFIGASVGSKKLISLANDRYLSLQAAYQYVKDDIDTYSVGADYYLNRNLSVGVGVDWFDDPLNFDETRTNVGANWFVTPSVSVSAGVSFIDTDSRSDELYQVGLSARF